MYTYKGNEYKVNEGIKVKDPHTREWVEMITYRDQNGQLYARDAVEFYQRFKYAVDIKIPYHISVMGKLFGKIKDEENITTGEIKRFIVPPKTMKKGQRITSDEYKGEDEYCALWVYIAQGYFKQIGLWKKDSHLIPAI